ncbi:EcoRII N-terminal effector-binding domain-containing protein [Pseudarthrobacter sp. NIBRBAC000502770]|uniref:EcoRII N-terminal effector-binding domain-containing protein n=1 Tax=Pseudarthrobacter sp. NIBRBAC000502770 TaxID=2590785 RepID=UPI0011402A02|nr:EcoRII N-terminal effector-binding domain-containing protein [Pseudarthrobacter sp. NIBRBAC000502770]QDG87523.1 restriction endonuclease [Pseudarthrobacter sp. NIBRBAC000502770]
MTRLGEVRKLLSANDLGLTGAHQAGITIPKDPEILAFFPPLDVTAYNPDFWMTVATPETGQHWSLRFVYYNNKTHGQGTRNEYRLTHTTQMLRALSASAGDELAFRRSSFGDIEAVLHEAEDVTAREPMETILRNGWRMIITDNED